MSSTIETAATPAVGRTAYWAGWVLSGLLIAFLLFDAGLKLLQLDIVDETMTQLGWPVEYSRMLGVITLVCVVLYAYPRTAVLGAILMTAYLGGAMATHIRVGSPLFSHVLFSVYLGLFLWGGLYLRDPRVRALIPWRAA
jgi:hypothetical protein